MSKAGDLFEHLAVINGLLYSMNHDDLLEAYTKVEEFSKMFKPDTTQYLYLKSMTALIGQIMYIEDHRKEDPGQTSPR